MPAERPVGGDLESLLRQACAELEAHLRSGQPCSAETLLDAYPLLASDVRCAVELILTEFQVRRQQGETLDAKDWLGRFPPWAGELFQRFRALGVLESDLSGEATTDGPTVAHTQAEQDTLHNERWPTLGHYELLGEIGRGGMGVVFRARDTLLDRIVALKMIRSGVLAEPAEIDRFHREARAAARIQHPHIVPVHELGVHGGQYYLSMVLAEGGSLDRHRQRFKAPRAAAVLMEKVARAVGAAHERDIVHRDLKPSNILLDDRDEPLVSDFGLAKFLQDDSELTQSGQLIGTPAYMAPEQAGAPSGPVTPATDVWALGVILYELLTGKRPFLATENSLLASHIRNEEPRPPRSLCPAVDAGLQAIVLHCLEKGPGRRYRNGTDLADDLRRWLNGEPTVVRPPRWPARLRRRVRRHPVWCLALVLLLAGTAAAPVGYWLREPPDRLARERDAKLRRGAAVILVGASGPPRESRWVSEPGAFVDSTKLQHVLTIQSLGLSMLELADHVPAPRYRLRGQVRHVDNAPPISRVGLYCLYQSWARPQGVEHFLCDLTLNDRVKGPSRRVGLTLRRFRGPEWPERCNNTYAPSPVPLKPDEPAETAPWRDLTLIVTQEEVASSLDGAAVHTLQRRDFPSSSATLFDDNRLPIDLPPPFPTEGGVGLFVYRGTACFRNVVLEPLP